jgi:hypothetical protein
MARCESAIHDGTILILTDHHGGMVDGEKHDVVND